MQGQRKYNAHSIIVDVMRTKYDAKINKNKKIKNKCLHHRVCAKGFRHFPPVLNFFAKIITHFTVEKKTSHFTIYTHTHTHTYTYIISDNILKFTNIRKDQT